jgi:diguanylate cyclase (GGDEF)-like protein
MKNMFEKKYTLLKRVSVHMIFGSLTGLLILHPLSMLIHDIIEFNLIHFISLAEIYSPKHLIMAGYFMGLGCIIGMFRAFYIHKRIELYEELKRLSITDELTSLYNRRYFDNQLNKEIERAQRYSHKLSLLIVDLDKFKQFNDTYGHRQGDELIKNIAFILNSSVRKPDFVARYGGDEFVIVMPETGSNEAHKLIERIKEKINIYRQERVMESGESVSVSIGSATLPDEAQDIDTLINKADKNLYLEKNENRALV